MNVSEKKEGEKLSFSSSQKVAMNGGNEDNIQGTLKLGANDMI